MTSASSTTPAKGGAHLGNGSLAGTTLRYSNLSNWAPAFAGVVF